MFFSSPLWLLALVPWTALLIWMFRAQPNSVTVPFINLWRGNLNATAARRSLTPPGFPVVAILLALLLAILVAAGPRLRTHGATQPLTIILDRGLTMMPEARTTPLLQRANRELLNAFSPSSPVTLITIPTGQTIETDLSDWLSQALALPPFPIPTDDAIEQAVLRAKADALVVAITDKSIVRAAPNVIQFAPDPIKNNIAIVSLGARQAAHPEVMVRIRNHSDRTKATLRLTSGAVPLNRDITLPLPGHEANFFFPITSLAPTLEASIPDPDDFPLDNTAWLARERSFPKINTAPDVGPDVQRVIKAFEKTHPPSEDSPPILVAPAPSPDVTADVLIATSLQPVATSTIDITTHPITANFAVSSLPGLSAAATPRDWLPLMRSGGRTLLAARDTPRHQVWIGFTADNFSSTADFVVLWTNILNWLAGSSDEYTFNTLAPLSNAWMPLNPSPQSSQSPGLWPGIYRSPDGTLRALNISPVTFPTQSSTDFPVLPKRLLNTAAIDPSPTILFLILALLLVAALTLPSHRLTRPSPAS